MENYSNDINIKMKLRLEEMYFGITKKIKYKRKKPCANCNNAEGCANCSNKGLILEESVEEIKIPEGIDSDMVLKFKHKGHFFIEKKKLWEIFSSKKNNSKNRFGSLIIKVEQIEHEVFFRDGADLIYNCQIKQSLLNKGDKTIEFLHLNGETIKVLIPKNTMDGRVFRIRAKGFKSIADNERGSLLIIIKVVED